MYFSSDITDSRKINCGNTWIDRNLLDLKTELAQFDEPLNVINILNAVAPRKFLIETKWISPKKLSLLVYILSYRYSIRKKTKRQKDKS